ncbi:translation elongation factor Ts [Aureibacter tunicatorum]|uniref:Elongation factor Ts n=1 Tax=Aureibacter tunicatorum TaxID=866807 RepID=A0AAE3XLF3_9BACT|nr:translation elongation factor Ts [Aureibacter tunicatorum]MDR6238095.1 elongation factor Ts [Aureibacter tunicatorum]BDD03128.1 elongation factor Ts [Aureibacter tunicatorum]
MAISAKQVNELRKTTGAGMMDCKKALVEAEGDFDKAIEILRKKGQKVSAKRADRETSEGVVVAKNNADNSKVVMLALTCETDFVAKNDDFVKLANDILEAAVAGGADSAEAVLALELNGQAISEVITENIGKIGEKIEVKNFTIVEGEKVAAYIHGNKKLGVAVALENVGDADFETAGKDVGMQVAAMNPIALNKDEVPAEVVEQEMRIGKEKALAEGKPEAIVEKIATGMLNKYFKDNTLLAQDFVKDSSVSVEKYLNSLNKGMTVTKFVRVSI